MNNIFVADELMKLKQLLDDGILTEEEFLLQKKKLLNTNNNNAENQISKYNCVIDGIEYDLTEVAKAIDNKNHNSNLASIFSSIVTLQPQEYAALMLYYQEHKSFPTTFNTKNGTSSIFQNRNADKILCCPKCGSTAITTGQRGWKLTTGFLGSSKTVNRCGACGHTWKP